MPPYSKRESILTETFEWRNRRRRLLPLQGRDAASAWGLSFSRLGLILVQPRVHNCSAPRVTFKRQSAPPEDVAIRYAGFGQPILCPYLTIFSVYSKGNKVIRNDAE